MTTIMVTPGVIRRGSSLASFRCRPGSGPTAFASTKLPTGRIDVPLRLSTPGQSPSVPDNCRQPGVEAVGSARQYRQLQR